MTPHPVHLWHEALHQADPTDLKALIHKDCIFHSPILFKPQEGGVLTRMYLTAAFWMFKGGDHFEYVKEFLDDDAAVLEFNSVIDGIRIDGIDMITWNRDGKIIEFKVMLRPLKAIEKVGQEMMNQLEKLSTKDKVKIKADSLIRKLIK